MPLSSRTLHEYRNILRLALVGDEIDRRLVEHWSSSRLGVLRAALKWHGLNVEVPRSKVRRRRKDLPVPVESELVAIEKAAAALEPGKRALVLIILFAGLRAQEVLQLQRKRVERALEVGELQVTRKGDYEARLPAEHLKREWRALLDAPAASGKPWRAAGEILSSSDSHMSRYCTLRRLIRSVGRAAGIRGLRPHLLRHAFATRLIRDGASVPVVQRWLGHASITTTMVYMHPDASDLTRYARAPKPPTPTSGPKAEK